MWIFREPNDSTIFKSKLKTKIPGRTKGATDPHTVPGHPGTPDREVQKIIIRTFQEPSKKLVKITE